MQGYSAWNGGTQDSAQTPYIGTRCLASPLKLNRARDWLYAGNHGIEIRGPNKKFCIFPRSRIIFSLNVDRTARTGIHSVHVCFGQQLFCTRPNVCALDFDRLTLKRKFDTADLRSGCSSDVF